MASALMENDYVYPIILFLALNQQVLLAQALLKGAIKDPSGKVLALVAVGLLNADSALVKTTASDEQGYFIFEKLENIHLIRPITLGEVWFF